MSPKIFLAQEIPIEEINLMQERKNIYTCRDIVTGRWGVYRIKKRLIRQKGFPYFRIKREASNEIPCNHTTENNAISDFYQKQQLGYTSRCRPDLAIKLPATGLAFF